MWWKQLQLRELRWSLRGLCTESIDMLSMVVVRNWAWATHRSLLVWWVGPRGLSWPGASPLSAGLSCTQPKQRKKIEIVIILEIKILILFLQCKNTFLQLSFAKSRLNPYYYTQSLRDIRTVLTKFSWIVFKYSKIILLESFSASYLVLTIVSSIFITIT